MPLGLFHLGKLPDFSVPLDEDRFVGVTLYRIKDDPQWLDLTGQKQALKRGYLAFAGSGPDSRTTEFFFAFRDLKLGFQPWEVPFGELVGAASYAALDRFYAGYGDMRAFGG